MVAAVDANGRLLLPDEIKCRMSLSSGDKFLIEMLDEGTIILKRVGVLECFENWLSSLQGQ